MAESIENIFNDEEEFIEEEEESVVEEVEEEKPIVVKKKPIVKKEKSVVEEVVDLKKRKYVKKMNCNMMQSILNIFNAEILKFAKKINAEFPDVPVNGVLNIWCQLQNIEMSAFGVENSVQQNNSDAEDDVRSSDDEVDIRKVKKIKTKSKKDHDPNKECRHMYIKGKNAGVKCTTIVKGSGNYCSKHKQKYAE